MAYGASKLGVSLVTPLQHASVEGKDDVIINCVRVMYKRIAPVKTFILSGLSYCYN